MSTTRATIVSVGTPFADEAAARLWLEAAGEAELASDVAVLAQALHAYRLASADAHLRTPARAGALVARIGFGVGEEVAEGRWSEARELRLGIAKRGRAERLEPQARFAAILTGRDRPLASEELALRARLDIEERRPREAAMQTLVALDAALTELQTDASGSALGERLKELRELREPTARAARAALSGSPGAGDQEAVAFALGRIEAALRARSAARG